MVLTCFWQVDKSSNNFIPKNIKMMRGTISTTYRSFSFFSPFYGRPTWWCTSRKPRSEPRIFPEPRELWPSRQLLRTSRRRCNWCAETNYTFKNPRCVNLNRMTDLQTNCFYWRSMTRERHTSDWRHHLNMDWFTDSHIANTNIGRIAGERSPWCVTSFAVRYVVDVEQLCNWYCWTRQNEQLPENAMLILRTSARDWTVDLWDSLYGIKKCWFDCHRLKALDIKEAQQTRHPTACRHQNELYSSDME